MATELGRKLEGPKIKAGERVQQQVLGPGTAETNEDGCRVYVKFDNPEVGNLWRYTEQWYCPGCEPGAEQDGFLVRPMQK